jgi:16S rRNA processing protein RimM
LEKRILLGAVAAAHGISGEVKVKTFTASPESLGAYGPLATGDGRTLAVASLRASRNDEAVVRFEGIADRNAAEGLKGAQLYVSRAVLPEPEKGEFYQTDLIGLKVENADGVRLGTVSRIHNFGAGDVVEIELLSGTSELVPFTDAFVPVVDIAAGRIVAELPRYADDDDHA